MRSYKFEDFSDNDAWLIFRVDTQIQHQPVDIYMVMDLPSGEVLAIETVETEPSLENMSSLLMSAQLKKNLFPHRLLLTKNDPAQTLLETLSKEYGMELVMTFSDHVEGLVAPLKKSFGEFCFSPSCMGYSDNLSEEDSQSIRKMIPDSYDLCPCASGKKYKFCCKCIFQEITAAMSDAEDGNYTEALTWIEKAKSIVGETAEVLCRESIVYSYFDEKKGDELLSKCFSVNPLHPRAHYIKGISLKSKNDFSGAIKAYKTAIENYPETDYMHLNETYNNLGTAFYAMGNVVDAKALWETALLYLPLDTMTRKNLEQFIYHRPIK